MSSCSRRERGDKREEDQSPTTTNPYNNCFLLCHHLLNQYILTRPHPPSLRYICPPHFSQQQCLLILLVNSPKLIQPLSALYTSSNHSLPSILHPTTLCPLYFIQPLSALYTSSNHSLPSIMHPTTLCPL